MKSNVLLFSVSRLRSVMWLTEIVCGNVLQEYVASGSVAKRVLVNSGG